MYYTLCVAAFRYEPLRYHVTQWLLGMRLSVMSLETHTGNWWMKHSRNRNSGNGRCSRWEEYARNTPSGGWGKCVASVGNNSAHGMHCFKVIRRCTVFMVNVRHRKHCLWRIRYAHGGEVSSTADFCHSENLPKRATCTDLRFEIEITSKEGGSMMRFTFLFSFWKWILGLYGVRSH